MNARGPSVPLLSALDSGHAWGTGCQEERAHMAFSVCADPLKFCGRLLQIHSVLFDDENFITAHN